MTLLVGSIFHMTRKIVSEMTYNVSMGTLNPTIPYHTQTSSTPWPKCSRLVAHGPNVRVPNVCGPNVRSPLGLISFYVCFLMIFFLTKVSLLVLWLVILCFWLFGSSLVVSTGAVDCLDLRSLKPGFHYPS